MDQVTRSVVAVRPGSALRARPRLFAALEEAFPVEFRAWSAGEGHIDGLLDIGQDGAGDPASVPPGTPVLAIAGSGPDAAPEAVELGDVAPVDRRVRGIVLHDRLARPLDVADGEAVLATAASGPAWVLARDGAPVHRVRSVLPELAQDEVLYALLSGRAIAMVALVHFLRALPAAATAPRPAPLRAAILFDDPNLRWRTYGFIDYRRLLEHADAHGYHAAMAMIPMDAGRPHRPTVGLYAARPDRLSLVYHGNDHIDNELLSAADPDIALATAAQAVRRVAAFERRAGLPVQRVMIPPHGRCSEAMAGALGAVGFDALCAIHPRPWTGRPPAEPLLAGWHPAEFIGGCAVIPRVPLVSSDADLALRAFLDHPLVIYGHHEDVAGGLEPLADMAQRVARLGDVRWMSVGEIALSNYELQVSAGHVDVHPYARRLRMTVPKGVRTVGVRAPRDERPEAGVTGWRIDGGRRLRFGARIPVSAGQTLEIRLAGTADVDPFSVPAPAWRPWPRMRRATTEARDRMLPLRPGGAAAI